MVTTVFGLCTDNDMWKAFVYDMGSEDLLDIYRLTGMAPINVAELDFKPNKWAKTTVPLSRGLRSYITIFQAMYHECQKKSDLTPEKILTLTFDKFDKFRVENQTQQAQQPANQVPPSVLPMSRIPPHGPLVEFKKGIKHDPTNFQAIKDINQWGSWKRMLPLQRLRIQYL